MAIHLDGQLCSIEITIIDTDWHDYILDIIFFLPVDEDYEAAEEEAQSLLTSFIAEHPRHKESRLHIDRMPKKEKQND